MAMPPPPPPSPGKGKDKDKRKSYPPLGPSSATPSASPRASPGAEMKAHYLVVCGATGPIPNYWIANDSWIFSDFMAISSYLDMSKVSGTYMSCFPIEEFWAACEKEKKPPVVKFGTSGLQSKSYISYSKFQWANREKFFEQVNVSDLKTRVLDWFRETARVCRSGDCVNVFFLSHGTKAGALHIGDKTIDKAEMRDLTRQFLNEVQVNVMISACYSGHFRDVIRSDNQYYRYVQTAATSSEPSWSKIRSASGRIRNGVFTQAVCESMFGAIRRSASQISRQTLGTHETYLKQESSKGHKPATPQFYQGDPVRLGSLVRDLMFRNNTDVTYDQQTGSRRSRIEWPTADQPLKAAIASNTAPRFQFSGANRASAEDFISSSVQFLQPFATAAEAACDQSVVGIMLGGIDHFSDPEIALMICSYYWRARMQSAIFNTLEMLLERGILGREVLATHVDAEYMDENCGPLNQVLSRFQYCRQAGDFENNTVIGRCNRHFTHFAIQWLAIAIVRGWRGEITQLMEHIEFSGHLGTFVHDDCPGVTIVRRDPTCGITNQPRPTRIWGWILPSGLNYVATPPSIPPTSPAGRQSQWLAKYQQFLANFCNAEKLYKNLCNVPDSAVMLDPNEEAASTIPFEY